MGDIPSSNQGNSGHQSHRTWAGVRGFGSPAPPKSPRLPPYCAPSLRGGLWVGLWQAQACSCSPTTVSIGDTHHQVAAPEKPTQAQPTWPPASSPALMTSPTCPQQRWKNAGQGLIQRPGGKSRGRSRKGSPQHLSPCWKSRQPCKGGRVGAEGSLLSLAGTALVQAWQSVTSPGTGTGP